MILALVSVTGERGKSQTEHFPCTPTACFPHIQTLHPSFFLIRLYSGSLHLRNGSVRYAISGVSVVKGDHTTDPYCIISRYPSVVGPQEIDTVGGRCWCHPMQFIDWGTEKRHSSQQQQAPECQSSLLSEQKTKSLLDVLDCCFHCTSMTSRQPFGLNPPTKRGYSLRW